MGVDVGGWEIRNFVKVRDRWRKWFTLGEMSGRIRVKRNVWRFVIVEDLGMGWAWEGGTCDMRWLFV